MRDASLLGPWVRRFLTEHMAGERNLARNTQRSYRDTLRLLLPSRSPSVLASRLIASPSPTCRPTVCDNS